MDADRLEKAASVEEVEDVLDSLRTFGSRDRESQEVEAWARTEP